MLQPVAESFDATNVTHTFVLLAIDPLSRLFDDEVIKEVGADIKLNCVVARGDRLDIPLDIIVLLNLLHVVKVVDDEESDENCNAAQQQRFGLALTDLFIVQGACNLKEHKTLFSITFIFVELRAFIVEIAGQVCQLTDRFAHAVRLDLLLKRVGV